jgi:hypothetical protein
VVQARPEALPPESRTVGQLVAETLRLYGARFWRALPLGIAIAVADQFVRDLSFAAKVLVLIGFAPFLSLTFAAAAVLVSGRTLALRAWLLAVAVGTLAFVPAAFLLPWFALLAFAWLAFVGLVVPVVVIEDAGPRAAFGRAVRLAQADYIHALGSLATLGILFFVTRLMMALLLRDQSEQTERIAVFLADLVISPILFLGAALLYFDQKARLESPSRDRKES